MPHRDPVKAKVYRRAYYLANREKLIAYARDWNTAHPEEVRAGQRRRYAAGGHLKSATYREVNNARITARDRAYYAAHPERASLDNRVQRMRRYGLTIASYEAMLEAQEGLCAVCGQAETHRGKSGKVTLLAVDHDHVTGSVRALLCHSCNTGVGLFLDNPGLLRKAAEYLER